jgi:hypothetical protein
VFYLAEMWGLPYTDAMRIPWSRRQRLVEDKRDLERRREAARKGAGSRARRGR